MNRSKMKFIGPLAEDFATFASLMRATRAPHRQTLLIARRLDRFLAVDHPTTITLTKEILHDWFATFMHLRPTSQARYRTATFQLCKFFNSRNPETATRDDFEPLRRSRDFKPYIFSIEQIVTLLQAARALAPRPCDPLRPFTIFIPLGIGMKAKNLRGFGGQSPPSTRAEPGRDPTPADRSQSVHAGFFFCKHRDPLRTRAPRSTPGNATLDYRDRIALK